MKIPKKIHFCGNDYTIVEVKNLNDGDALGKTLIDKLEIHLDKDQPKSLKEETFIHELLHIAYQHSGKILSTEDQEKIVSPWSRNMYGILKDNNLLK